MRISRILLPVDFSEQGAGVAKQCAALAQRFGAAVTMLHVIPPYEPIYYGGEFGGPVDYGWIQSMEAFRQEKLEHWAADIFEGVTVQRRVAIGDAAGQIAEFAKQEEPDLIMIATHGYGPFRRFLLGSVTAKVLHDAHCPVWTGAHLAEPATDWKPVHHVVCALDLNPGSECVADWAWQFTQAFQATMTAVHALPEVEFVDPQWILHIGEIADAAARELLYRLDADCKVVVSRGDPARTIAEEARRLEADVLIIGRSRPGGHEPGRLHTGAYSIIRESPCPVISV